MPTLRHLLPHHARYRSNYPALEFEESSLSFDELDRRVNQLAHALLDRGLVKGDCFATLLPNSIELMTAYWAAAASGLVIVPCSVMLQANGIRTLLGDANARLVLIESSLLAVAEPVLQQLPEIARDRIITVGDPVDGYSDYQAFTRTHSEQLPEVEIDEHDIYNIMYSSGTTGLPKGIIHTHHIRSMYCTLFASAWRMTPESVVLHAGAIVFNGAMLDLMPWMYLGCRYILHKSFDPERVLDDIEQHQVTHIVMVPAQIIALLNSPAYRPERLHSLEMIHNVGAPLHLRYKQQINQQLPDRFYELYGVTEGFMTVLDKTEAILHEGSVGKPAAFTELVIMDDDGNPLAQGEVGEICGRGPLVMPGYHNRPEQTRDAFHGSWLRSGDLGYLDKDGYLFLVDRAKDMIISGGVNVYPRDIEEVVIAHPAVEEVAVFGINNEKWGEVPVAAVRLVVDGESVTADNIRDFTNERVDARFQRLDHVIVLDDFPRTVAGKVLKRTLRERIEQNRPADIH